MCKPSENYTTVLSTFPMHWPTQGQWWSKRSTQLLQIEQWEHLGGRYNMHVWQYLTLTTTPFTRMSFVGGKLWAPCWLPGQSADILEDSPTSSGSGGWAFRGTMPGSLPDVRRRRERICTNLESEEKAISFLLCTICDFGEAQNYFSTDYSLTKMLAQVFRRFLVI